jgi:hypothetical protein
MSRYKDDQTNARFDSDIIIITHVVLKVLTAEGKFRSDITLIDTVDPSTHRHDTIKKDRHPPSAAPKFQFKGVIGRRQVGARRIVALSRERPRIVQAKWYRRPCLETSKYPDLDPTALGIEVPR